MGLFEMKRNAQATESKDRIADIGWTAFRNSKDPEKQVVLDYMSQYGIELVKSKSGLYYISHLNSRDFEGFQRITNFRAKISTPGMVAVEMNNGEIEDSFTTLEDAYRGLVVLYESARKTKGDDDF